MSSMYTREELLALGIKHIGQDVKVYKNVIFTRPGGVTLESGCQIDDFVMLLASEIYVGKRVHVATMTSVIGGGTMIFEDYSGCSSGCRLITGTDNFVGDAMANASIPIEYRKVERGVIRLCKFVLLGANTVVFPNVTISEGTATGACSLVHKDLKEWSIYLGSPAKYFKPRRRDMIPALCKKMVEKYGY